jgi:hypothetical protein
MHTAVKSLRICVASLKNIAESSVEIFRGIDQHAADKPIPATVRIALDDIAEELPV